MHSINLLPEQCRDQRRRNRRGFAWVCVSGAALVVLSLGYAWAVAADDTRDRLAATLATTRAREADAERALTLTARERNGYLDSTRRVISLHGSVRLPERLESLVDALPAGVYLTDLRASLAPTAAPPAAASVAKPAVPTSAPARRPPEIMRFELHGLAGDHQVLRTFIDAVNRLDTFENVELMQATRETRNGVGAVRFRVDCRQIEESP